MKIAILGTRGIPNNHGGFEQFAEYLAPLLVSQGFDVTVYNSHNHPYQASVWKGVNIVHCYDPEYLVGSTGQFVYDLNCIVNTWKKKYDIILQLGYTSSSIWGSLYPKKNTIVTTNMDGLEWKRTKYSKHIRKFLRYAEKLAVKYSDYLISDSVGIQRYLKHKYDVDSDYIPYGARIANAVDTSVLIKYDLQPYEYNMLVARMEPENNIEMILDGVSESSSAMKFLVIGRYTNKFGMYIQNKYKEKKNILFLGGVYDINVLDSLRYYSNLYFHGHTVGGTNPSLLEAMASSALICAHDNIFNKSILQHNSHYFSCSVDIQSILDKAHFKFKHLSFNQQKIKNNLHQIEHQYSWRKVAELYINHFNSIKLFRSLVTKRAAAFSLIPEGLSELRDADKDYMQLTDK